MLMTQSQEAGSVGQVSLPFMTSQMAVISQCVAWFPDIFQKVEQARINDGLLSFLLSFQTRQTYSCLKNKVNGLSEFCTIDFNLR